MGTALLLVDARRDHRVKASDENKLRSRIAPHHAEYTKNLVVLQAAYGDTSL